MTESTEPTPPMSLEVQTEWEQRMSLLTHPQRMIAGRYAVAWMGLLCDLGAYVNAQVVRDIMAEAITEALRTPRVSS